MVETAGFSPLLDRALVVAALAHEEKKRKGTLVPYIMHPVHVALILQRYGFDDEVVTAGMLHDVVEDMPFGDQPLQERLARTFPHGGLPAGVSHLEFRRAFLAFLEAEFGPPVVDLVLMVSEPKNDGGPRLSWRQRREHQLRTLREASDRVAALKAADLLHNIRTTVEDLERHGADVMRRFNAPPEDSLWYYETAADLTAGRLGDGHPFGAEVRAAARRLRATMTRLGLTAA